MTLAAVLVRLDGVLGKAGEDEALVLGALAVDPLLERLAHEALDLLRVVVEVRVVERGEDLVRDVLRVARVVLPRLDDELDRVREDDDGDLAGGLVEEEGEAARPISSASVAQKHTG